MEYFRLRGSGCIDHVYIFWQRRRREHRGVKSPAIVTAFENHSTNTWYYYETVTPSIITALITSTFASFKNVAA